MTYIVDQVYPPVDVEDDVADCIEYTSFNYWRDPVYDFDLPVSRGSTPIGETSLQSVQSKPLATIPEN